MRLITKNLYNCNGMKCPVCGSDNSHITGTRFNDENYPCRNGNVIIRISCECGHDYEIVIREHKGFVCLDTAINEKDMFEFEIRFPEKYKEGVL